MIPLKDQELIRQKFGQELIGPVKIDHFTQRESDLLVPGQKPCTYCKPTREMLQELSALSDLISLRMHVWKEAQEEAKRFGIERVPGTAIRGRNSTVYKYYGIPGGSEFAAFIESITDISRGETLLSAESVKALAKLKDDVSLRVFVTPTCPYCPMMARLAFQLALVSPKVQAEVIEVNEFPELGDRYSVRAVPLTVINDRVAIPGAVHESVLVEQVVKAAQSAVSEPGGASGPTTPAEAPPQEQAPRRGEQRPSGLIIP